MTTRGLSHFNLHAKRELLDALKDFYCDVVGLSVGPRPAFPRFGYWLYAGSNPIVHLYQAGPDEERKPQVVSTFDHIAFDCTDRTEVEARLAGLGLPYRNAFVPGSDQVQLLLVDPAGNGVELNFATSDV